MNGDHAFFSMFDILDLTSALEPRVCPTPFWLQHQTLICEPAVYIVGKGTEGYIGVPDRWQYFFVLFQLNGILNSLQDLK